MMTINLIKVDGSWCFGSTCLLLVQNSSNCSEKTFFRCSLVWNLTLMLGFTIIVLQARWSIGALPNKESNKLLRKIPCFVAVPRNPSGGLKARQRHHQGSLPPGGKDLPDHPFPCGTGHPSCHRSGLGQRRSGYPPALLWIHGQQYQGKTHKFGVYRPYRWQIAASAEVFWGCQFLIGAQRFFVFFFWLIDAMKMWLIGIKSCFHTDELFSLYQWILLLYWVDFTPMNRSIFVSHSTRSPSMIA